MSRLIAVLFVAFLGTLTACSQPAGESPAAASAGGEQAAMVDAVAVSPDVYQVVVESERMRVMVATWQAAQTDKPHGHPRMVLYALTNIDGVVRDNDGAQTPIWLKAGSVLVQEASQSSSFENKGAGVAKLLLFELRAGKPVGQIPQGSLDPQVASPEIFELMAFDSNVRVLRATWQPNQSDKLHGHPALVAYALTDITGQLTTKDGTAKPVSVRAGSALLEGPVAGHSFQNLGTEPAQMLLVEARK